MLIFIFLCSHELEKDLIKKKMKSYGETETELKILIKKMRFNLMMKAFTSIKATKKVYKKRSENQMKSKRI